MFTIIIHIADSDSDSDDDSTFYSPSAKLGRKNRKKKAQARKVLPQGQSEVTINLVIGHGVCSFFTPFEVRTCQDYSELEVGGGRVTICNVFFIIGLFGEHHS